MTQLIHCKCVCFSSILLLLMTDKTHGNKFNSLSKNLPASCSVLTQSSHFSSVPQKLIVVALVLLILCNCEVEWRQHWGSQPHTGILKCHLYCWWCCVHVRAEFWAHYVEKCAIFSTSVILSVKSETELSCADGMKRNKEASFYICMKCKTNECASSCL